MGWENSTRKSLVGSRVALKATGEECHVAPKKLPTEVVDEVRSIRLAMLEDGDNPERMRAYQAIFKKAQAEGRDPTEDEVGDLLKTVPHFSKAMRTAIYRLYLTHGIGEHDFADDAGALVGGGRTFPEEIVMKILEWDDLASEIGTVVEGWNAPLAKTPVETSAT